MSCAPQVTLPRDLVLTEGIEPTFAPYQRAGLPLTYISVAERPGFEPDALSSTIGLAGRRGTPVRLCAPMLAEGGGIEPLTLRSPWFSGPVAGHLAAPSIDWYPCADSNREPPRSKRGTSTGLGYRGELVRAVGFEPTLPRLSTSCLLPIGLRAHGAAPRIRTET
jgi:hypothetical protein